jgi:hypothetical protein
LLIGLAILAAIDGKQEHRSVCLCDFLGLSTMTNATLIDAGRPRWRLLGIGLLCSAITFISVFGVLEIYCRVASSCEPNQLGSPPGLFRPDQWTRFLSVAGLRKEFGLPTGPERFMVSTNSEGFRGSKEFPEINDQKKVRILIIGSSMPMGWGINDDEVFTEALEQRLNETNALGKKVEIINASLPGTHATLRVYQYLKRGRKYHPNIVIVFTQPDEPHERLDWIRDEKTVAEWLRPDPQFERKSRYYVDADGILRFHLAREPWMRPLLRYSAALRGIAARIRITSENERFRALHAQLAQPDEALNSLEDMRYLVKQDGASMFVVIAGGLQEFKEHPHPQEIMLEKLTQRGIPAVNLRPHFEPHENDGTLLVSDGHWNAAGHAIISKLVFELLLANRDYAIK